ncbi:cytochrome P450 [Infundibulicybe gibba]|nr:cytochrome P450 [Infundibulicybe gibba]
MILGFVLLVAPFLLFFVRPRHPLPPGVLNPSCSAEFGNSFGYVQGPRPLPLIGNLHQIPRKEAYKIYHQWSRIHGPVMYLRIFNREFIVLDSLKAITDLFEKRSSRYSTRPRFVMAGELVGKEDTALLFMKYGAKWKQARQLVHVWLNQRNVETYLPMQVSESCNLLLNLLETPEKFSEHLRTSIGSVILKLTYGIECKRHEDPWIAKSEELHKITALAIQPGRWLVDSFPILRFIPSFLPGASFLRWAKISREAAFNLVRLPYDQIKEQMALDNTVSSFVHDRLVEKGGKLIPQEEDALIVAAGSLYAGMCVLKKLVSTMRTFFMVMVRYPAVQKRVQREIETVVGPHRLARLEDRDALPYVGCLIKELLRFNSVAPLVAHSLDKDDIYEGYRIPKGAWVMANIWAVFNDPSVYHDPSSFNPDRFNPALDKPIEMDPTPISFCLGLGRRFCPASHFSLSTLFINITHIISVFDILPPADRSGEEIIPPLDFELGHIRTLKSFQCRIVPRSAQAVELIHDALAVTEGTT